MRILLSTALLLVVCLQNVKSQNYKDEFEQFRKEAQSEYNDFRKQCFDEYLKFVRQAWKEVDAERPIEIPEEEQVIPEITVIDQNTDAWLDIQAKSLKKKILKLFKKNRPKPIEKNESVKLTFKEIFKIKLQKAKSKPQPIAPVKEVTKFANDYKTTVFLGTECKVRIGENCRFKIDHITPNGIANAMEKFKLPQYDNLLHDCLQLRDSLQLSDWAYLMMLQAITNDFYGADTNEATLMMSFLYNQSGYKIRMGNDKTKLFLLVATDFQLIGRSFFILEGERYYMLRDLDIPVMSICNAKFPKEQSLSLLIRKEQKLTDNPSPKRTIKSALYPDFSITVSENMNLIDLFLVYPQATHGNNALTRWALHANTPISSKVKNEIYPQMREKLAGLSDFEAANRLLNWIQTGFVYALDKDVWGNDRTLFSEETLFYPYCDCEDRAILFSHLVRDLLGLRVALVHYPGHLAAAVNFKEDVSGDHFTHEGLKFTVCDPTIIGIGAPVGTSMTRYKKTPATLITVEDDMSTKM